MLALRLGPYEHIPSRSEPVYLRCCCCVVAVVIPIGIHVRDDGFACVALRCVVIPIGIHVRDDGFTCVVAVVTPIGIHLSTTPRCRVRRYRHHFPELEFAKWALEFGDWSSGAGTPCPELEFGPELN